MNQVITTSADNSHVQLGTAIMRKGNSFLIEQGSKLAQNLVLATIGLEAKNKLYKIAHREYKKRNWLYDTPSGHTLLLLKSIHEYERRYGIEDRYMPKFSDVHIDINALPYIHLAHGDLRFMDHIVSTIIDFSKCLDENMSCLGYSRDWVMGHIVAPNYIRWVIIPNNFKSFLLGEGTSMMGAQRYADCATEFWSQTGMAILDTVAQELQDKGCPDLKDRVQAYSEWLGREQARNFQELLVKTTKTNKI